MLVGALTGSVANALTVRRRAISSNLEEIAAASSVEIASWIVAIACLLTLVGVAARERGWQGQPSRALVWTMGIATIVSAFMVMMWTASLWV